MYVRVTERKRTKIKRLCSEALKKEEIVIREFATLTGKLMTTGSGVEYGPLYCKQLEFDKIEETGWQF